MNQSCSARTKGCISSVSKGTWLSLCRGRACSTRDKLCGGLSIGQGQTTVCPYEEMNTFLSGSINFFIQDGESPLQRRFLLIQRQRLFFRFLKHGMNYRSLCSI